MIPTCDAIVVTCIDFRIQAALIRWLDKNVGHGNYDRVGLAGSVKNRQVIVQQVEIARRLHEIRRVVLINHEDCGAYGAEGTLEKHTADLRRTRAEIMKKYPTLQIDMYYAMLDGTLDQVW